ncbi:hypothetical protein M408DRAFT_19125 [Serendipita vermifera MAFF 305830]|uniref:Uncharacterized protein n=1 Tax=Serendipita vermifera MAFF 305830 TaxID=933852 RepID=A0A0C3BQ27_SERVB|nr:hypothetical protein M408DRAFT_19125 [Serendipita vermifera MAFF 305830]
MQYSKNGLRNFNTTKTKAICCISKRAAYKSTVAKTSSSGLRPAPTVEQVKELEHIGRQLVDATVARRKKHTLKTWEKATLDEKRNILDKEMQELARPNKPKSQERLDFESLEGTSDYTSITPVIPTIDDSNRPRPGAFVELRRNTVVVHGVVLNEQLQGNAVKVNVITQKGEIWSNNPDDIMVSIPDFTPEHILEQISASDDAVEAQDAMARLKVIKQLDVFEQQITIMTNYYSPIVSKLYDKVRSQNPTQWVRLSLHKILTSHPPPPGRGDETTAAIALHKLLIQDPLYFVATEVHRSSLEFSARPLAEVENIKRVTQWIRGNSAEITDFIRKAKTIITLSRDIRDKAPQGPPTSLHYWRGIPSSGGW